MPNSEFHPKSLKGLSRKLIYSEQDGKDLLASHREIATETEVARPYFLFTDKEVENIFEYPIGERERVRAGLIGTYPGWMIAIWLQEQIHSYVIGETKTMGRRYPIDEEETNKELVGAMISGFGPDRLVVSFEQKNENDVWNPYAGVQAYPGRGTGTLRHAIESEHADSLSTLSALMVDWGEDDSITYLDFLREYGDTPESQVVEMSRLWRNELPVLGQKGIKDTEIGWEAMAYLARTIELAVLNGDYDALPSILLYDTNTKIQKMLHQKFHMRQIVKASDLKPTQEIMQSIYRYHYGPEEIGGYMGDLIMGMTTLGDYALAAKLYLQSRGLPWEG